MDDEALSFLLGVLEDYSNRYIGFGALFVTSLLGIYTLMGFNNLSIPKLVKIVMFVCLYLSGLISILFTYRYTRLTSSITSYILHSNTIFQNAWNAAISQNDSKYLQIITQYMYSGLKYVFLLIGFIYTVITCIPFFYYIGWLPSK